MGLFGVFFVVAMISARVWIGSGMGETVGVSILWGVVNVIAAAAGGLIAIFLFARR